MYAFCLKWDRAIFDSVGIATGNAATFVPLALLCALPLVYLFLHWTNSLPEKAEYDTAEVDAINNVLSTTNINIELMAGVMVVG
jgi:hypothetical protein